MEITQSKDIILPVELAIGKYSLQEIGAIVVLMCIPHLDDPFKEAWNKDEQLMDILDTFISEGIGKVETIDGVPNLTLDLTI